LPALRLTGIKCTLAGYIPDVVCQDHIGRYMSTQFFIESSAACFPMNAIIMRWNSSKQAVDPVAMKFLDIGDIVKVDFCSFS